jgi:hypothetical protein
MKDRAAGEIVSGTVVADVIGSSPISMPRVRAERGPTSGPSARFDPKGRIRPLAFGPSYPSVERGKRPQYEGKPLSSRTGDRPRGKWRNPGEPPLRLRRRCLDSTLADPAAACTSSRKHEKERTGEPLGKRPKPRAAGDPFRCALSPLDLTLGYCARIALTGRPRNRIGPSRSIDSPISMWRQISRQTSRSRPA